MRRKDFAQYYFCCFTEDFFLHIFHIVENKSQGLSLKCNSLRVLLWVGSKSQLSVQTLHLNLQCWQPQVGNTVLSAPSTETGKAARHAAGVSRGICTLTVPEPLPQFPTRPSRVTFSPTTPSHQPLPHSLTLPVASDSVLLMLSSTRNQAWKVGQQQRSDPSPSLPPPHLS